MQVGHLSFGPLVPTTVGFDRFFDSVEKLLSVDQSTAVKFPPHNIIRVDDNHYTIEMAVAGFTMNELDVVVQDGTLKIEGTKRETDAKKGLYLHRGIGNRDFKKFFQLADTVEVRDASLIDGILVIQLENVIPESKKPRKISLRSSPQLLNES